MERLTENNGLYANLKACRYELCRAVCDRIYKRHINCSHCPIQAAFDKLAEYEDAEEQGLLLRLPCHIGDIVYEPTNRGTINEYRIIGIKEEAYALWIEWKLEKGFIYQSIYGVETSDIGKTVFLTREEAEQKLKEMEENKDD